MKYTFDQLSELSRLDGGRFKTTSNTDALIFCKKISASHYENFPVASVMIPKAHRDHISVIYAFSRIADDIADENLDINSARRLEILTQYSNNYLSNENTTNPIFMAIRKTQAELHLPRAAFDRLIEAFRRDILFKQAKNFNDLIDYCSFSANPIGELVLRIFDNYEEKTRELSNEVCTALQLTNFWQDLSTDIRKNRIFIPLDIMKKYEINHDDILTAKSSDTFDACLLELINETEKTYIRGKELIAHIRNFRLKIQIKATIIGGMTILDNCKKNRHFLLKNRPKLNKSDIFSIFVKSIFS